MDIQRFLSVLYGSQILYVHHVEGDDGVISGLFTEIGFRRAIDEGLPPRPGIMCIHLEQRLFIIGQDVTHPSRYGHDCTTVVFPRLMDAINSFKELYYRIHGSPYRHGNPPTHSRFAYELSTLVYRLQGDRYLRSAGMSTRGQHTSVRDIFIALIHGHPNREFFEHRHYRAGWVEHPSYQLRGLSDSMHRMSREMRDFHREMLGHFEPYDHILTTQDTEYGVSVQVTRRVNGQWVGVPTEFKAKKPDTVVKDTVEVQFGQNLRKFIEQNRNRNLICIILNSHKDELESKVYEKVEISDEHFGMVAWNLRSCIAGDGMKPGKTIKQLLDTPYPRKKDDTYLTYYKVNNKHLEEFSTMVKAFQSGGDYKMELLPASRIPGVYNDPIVKRGRLVDSCMRGKGHLYNVLARQDSVEVLVCYDSDMIIAGRALVWTVKRRNGSVIKIMDRIYSSKEHVDGLFLEYAKSHGIWRKLHYTSRLHKTSFVTPDGETKKLRLKVKFDALRDDSPNRMQWPYLDTFCYLTDGYLCNYEAKGTWGLAAMTDGTYTPGLLCTDI